MKTMIFILFFALTTISANAQKINASEVPAAVTAAMAKSYPAVKKIKWEKEDANYEAEFELNEIETSVVFDSQGNIKETETEIAVSALPKTVTDYIKTNYKNYKINEGAKIVDANGMIMYEAEVKKGKEKFDLLFDKEGTFIRKNAQ